MMRKKKPSIETYRERTAMMEIAVKDLKISITSVPKNVKGNADIMRREILKGPNGTSSATK